MKKKLGSLGITALMMLIPLLAIIGLSLAYSEVGMAKDIGIQEPILQPVDYSLVPQEVMDKAAARAAALSKMGEQRVKAFADELLASYVEASRNDVVIIFNSGGLGWNLTEETPGWASILDGIQTQLENLGYNTIVMNYRRTGSGFTGVIGEVIEALRRYPNKIDDLVWRVEFLTENLPELKVIVAGESTGTVISDKAMARLQDQPHVYSIQTGMPFWHKPSVNDDNHTLLINDNGLCIDAFSEGNVPTMLWTTVKGWLGLAPADANPGNILSWLRAPGHDYSWQYPGVYDRIVEFIGKNFGERG